jgi:malonyl-CoA O-methyltransferase
MGAEIRSFAETALGESVVQVANPPGAGPKQTLGLPDTTCTNGIEFDVLHHSFRIRRDFGTRFGDVDALEGHRLWAACYDDAPNPLLALEMRVMREKIGGVEGLRVLDAGCGTGRWMRELSSRGAHVLGIDGCDEMIRRAPRPVALANVQRLPIADNSFDIGICSFVIGYVPLDVINELARVSRRVIVTDMHPDAGWTRSFRAGGDVIQLQHFNHSIAALDDCAQRAGLVPEWRTEVCFGEPERAIFERAGKNDLFERVRSTPAVLATIWRK